MNGNGCGGDPGSRPGNQRKDLAEASNPIVPVRSACVKVLRIYLR